VTASFAANWHSRMLAYSDAPQALLSTDLAVSALQIVEWFVGVGNWRSHFKTRAHVGIETQRQWSDLAILQTTSARLGPFSLLTSAHARIPSRVP
jgi:hypothetical protein